MQRRVPRLPTHADMQSPGRLSSATSRTTESVDDDAEALELLVATAWETLFETALPLVATAAAFELAVAVEVPPVACADATAEARADDVAVLEAEAEADAVAVAVAWDRRRAVTACSWSLKH